MVIVVIILVTCLIIVSYAWSNRKEKETMAFSDITVKQERRLCVVNGKMGYFHCWEHYSRPVEPSPMIGGAPGGVISFVRAIVEFPEGIGYVDPKDLKFCDEENVYLHRLLKIEDMRKEKKNGTSTDKCCLLYTSITERVIAISAF